MGFVMMRKILTLFCLLGAFIAHGQVEIDTLYYDKEWKVLDHKVFATYYRVLIDNDQNLRKQYRDYYISGELRTEGEYIKIDKNDDSHSVFDGKFVSYYKNGKIYQEGSYVNGCLEGEFVEYYDSGLMAIREYYKANKLDGIHTEFSQDGDICTQVEYRDGSPMYNYYVISNIDGLCSKVRISDDTPYYEEPKIDEMKVTKIEEQQWPYYDKNNVLVGMTIEKVRDYGKYYRVSLIIENYSMFPVAFNPDLIEATMAAKSGEIMKLRPLAVEDYMKKIKRRQNAVLAFSAIAEGFAAGTSSYTTSTTTTIGSYGNVYTSTTRHYDHAAAYQSSVLASMRLAAYTSSALAERETKKAGYLKEMTINPGESISGYVNIPRKRGNAMTIDINIDGVIYSFPWDLTK